MASTSASVRVSCRVRPFSGLEIRENPEHYIRIEGDGREIVLATRDSNEAAHTFTFDRVFSSESLQNDVFEDVAKPMVNDVSDGYNCTVFAYGQTGSGKTHTMVGNDQPETDRGIIPRVLASVMEKMESESPEREICVKISFLEVYLEKIRDLLAPNNTALRVRESRSRGVWVQGCTEVPCKAAKEAMALFAKGNANRKTGAHRMNSESSRSHSIFLITIVNKDRTQGANVVKTGKLYLVDLAGSETVRKTGASGQRLTEAKHINKSLTALGMVINALTDGKSQHVPYRDSKLTRILQDSLGGNAKTHLVITCSPSLYNLEETVSSLRFGSRAKNIKNKPRVNEEKSISEYKQILTAMEKRIVALSDYIVKLERKPSTNCKCCCKCGAGTKEPKMNAEENQTNIETKNAEVACMADRRQGNGQEEISLLNSTGIGNEGNQEQSDEKGRQKSRGTEEDVKLLGYSASEIDSPRSARDDTRPSSLDNTNSSHLAKCAVCECSGTTSDKDLFLCDGNCGQYFHPGCVELDQAPEGEWFCLSCRPNEEDEDFISQENLQHADAVKEIELLRQELLAMKKDKDRITAYTEVERGLFKSLDTMSAEARRKLQQDTINLRMELARAKEDLQILQKKCAVLEKSEGENQKFQEKEILLLREISALKDQSKANAAESSALRRSLEKTEAKNEHLRKEIETLRLQAQGAEQLRQDLEKEHHQLTKRVQMADDALLRAKQELYGRASTPLSPGLSPSRQAVTKTKIVRGADHKTPIQAWWNGLPPVSTNNEHPERPSTSARCPRTKRFPKISAGDSSSGSNSMNGQDESRPFKARLESLLNTIEAETDQYRELRQRSLSQDES